MRLVKIFVAGGLLALTSVTGFSQQAREVFGKNRIQYKIFDWQYLSGENFDIYYYDKRKAIASEALEFLESEFDRITDILGYPPYFKTKVFLYNSLSDLRQSNVGLNQTVFNVGGETEFIKPYVEVAHLGTIQEFKDELLFKISDLMVNEMMFGGNLKDVFQSSILMNLPDWFVDGVSHYVSRGWTDEMDDYMRQLMRTRKAKRIIRLTGNEAALAGQSVWNFIAEKYGKSSISNILNYTRLTRNEEKSILITLGISFKQLMSEWHKYYSDMESMVSKSYVNLADSADFTRQHNKTTYYTSLKISPDGRYIAYAENDRGRYIVKVRTLSSGKEKIILTGGSKVIKQRVDYSLPLISWSDDHTLGVIAVKKGDYVFWLYDLSTRSKLPRELDKFSNVRSFDFSNNGRLAILSADFEGQNDLFLLSTRRDRVKRLTNDLYDDLDPSFIANSNRIVFSSNRTTDTLKNKVKADFTELTDNYNLFVFDLDTTKSVVKRITNTLSKDYAPIAHDDYNFYYLSDQRGIVNLFTYNSIQGIYRQVTNFSSSVKDYDLNFNTNTLALVTTSKMKQNIFVVPEFNINRQVFTPVTRRKELQQAQVVREKRKQDKTENKSMSIKDLLNSRRKETQVQKDSISSDTTATAPDSSAVVKAPEPEPIKEETINTDNYQFEDETVKQNQPSETLLTRYMKAHDKQRIMGPFPYESKFSANNIVTSLVIDQLRGLGVLLEVQMNDMLENYRFYGGMMATVDLKNSDTYAEFQYLPGKFDLSARFDRKTVYWEPASDEPIYRYALHKLEVGIAFPLSDRFRFTVKPFGALTYSINLGESIQTVPPTGAPTNHSYIGTKSELVYDNSVSTGLNLIEGTRGKIIFNHYEGVDNSKNSFSQVAIDLRHYQKLYKEIVFAVRGFGGTFFGQSPKQYLLGGMDNWLFNQSSTTGASSNGEMNPLGRSGENQDLLFLEYATSLRGFDYASIFGNTALLANVELRIPIIRALTNASISSTFLKNLQFVGFYDIGTSWSGKAPFNSENSVSLDIIKRPPFEVTVKNFLNPWLYSYGMGVRTVLFGYYAKFDLAWPVENYQVKDPRGFLTIGFDF